MKKKSKKESGLTLWDGFRKSLNHIDFLCPFVVVLMVMWCVGVGFNIQPASTHYSGFDAYGRCNGSSECDIEDDFSLSHKRELGILGVLIFLFCVEVVFCSCVIDKKHPQKNLLDGKSTALILTFMLALISFLISLLLGMGYVALWFAFDIILDITPTLVQYIPIILSIGLIVSAYFWVNNELMKKLKVGKKDG